MTKHGTILLIEHDENDVLLLRKAFLEAEVINPVQIVNSYEDAVKYLSGDAMYANRASFPVPFLVLLDLQIPDEGGFALLRWLYERPGLRKQFTVVALCAADTQQDVQLAYELGAQSCLLKPSEYRQMVPAIRRLKEYWIELNRLPGDSD